MLATSLLKLPTLRENPRNFPLLAVSHPDPFLIDTKGHILFNSLPSNDIT